MLTSKLIRKISLLVVSCKQLDLQIGEENEEGWKYKSLIHNRKGNYLFFKETNKKRERVWFTQMLAMHDKS